MKDWEFTNKSSIGILTIGSCLKQSGQELFPTGISHQYDYQLGFPILANTIGIINTYQLVEDFPSSLRWHGTSRSQADA